MTAELGSVGSTQMSYAASYELSLPVYVTVELALVSALIAFGTDTRFGSGAEAAKLLGDGDNAVAIVGGDQADAFKAALDAAHVVVEPLGTVTGFNYAKGKRIALTLYRRAP